MALGLAARRGVAEMIGRLYRRGDVEADLGDIDGDGLPPLAGFIPIGGDPGLGSGDDLPSDDDDAIDDDAVDDAHSGLPAASGSSSTALHAVVSSAAASGASLPMPAMPPAALPAVQGT